MSGPPPGGPRRLSLELIVGRALDLIEDRGVASATMRGLGATLGVQAMALYRYVSTRDDLLDKVVDRILAELGHDTDLGDPPGHRGWRDYLTDLAHDIRAYSIEHPEAFTLLSTRPVSSSWLRPPVRSVAWVEQLFRTLRADGFSTTAAIDTYRRFNQFLLGALLGDSATAAHEHAVARAPHRTAADAPARSTAAHHPARTTVDPDRYPIVSSMTDELEAAESGNSFEQRLTELLDSVAARNGRGGPVA